MSYIKKEPGLALPSSPLEILDLPIELLEEILSYMSYDQIAHLRIVCRVFNKSCGLLLNRGFLKVEKFHAHCLRKVKVQLPRRESERRNHPLARHCDVLSAIETRLSLLGMTYMKYVDMNLCCFIPGKVVDEIYKVLRFIQNNPNPPRVHELLQELRDISSMAMEYFEEKVAPTLKQRLTGSGGMLAAAVAAASIRHSSLSYRPTSSSTPSTALFSTPSRSQADVSEYTKLSASVTSFQKKTQRENSDTNKKLKEAERKIQDLSQTISEQGGRIAEQDAKIAEFQQRLLEFDRHLSPARPLKKEVVPVAEVKEETSEGRVTRARSKRAAAVVETPCKSTRAKKRK